MSTTSITEVRPILMDEYLELLGPDIIRVKGHRIGLEHIVERYEEGYSPEQIALDLPGLGLPQIYGIIAYYLRNQPEVHAYLKRVNSRAEAAYQEWSRAPSAATQRVRALLAQRSQRSSQ